MFRIKSLLWFTTKTWILACVMLVAGQVRIDGVTILHSLDLYFATPAVAKHYAKIVYPIHLILSKTGFNVGWDKIERTIAYQQSTEEKIRDTFGADAGQQLDKAKKAAEEQKKALESIEKDLAP